MDNEALNDFRGPSESLEVRGRVAWLNAPEDIRRSKLAEKLHRVVKEAGVTGRNLNTVRALAYLAQ